MNIVVKALQPLLKAPAPAPETWSRWIEVKILLFCFCIFCTVWVRYYQILQIIILITYIFTFVWDWMCRIGLGGFMSFLISMYFWYCTLVQRIIEPYCNIGTGLHGLFDKCCLSLNANPPHILYLFVDWADDTWIERLIFVGPFCLSVLFYHILLGCVACCCNFRTFTWIGGTRSITFEKRGGWWCSRLYGVRRVEVF